MKVLVHNKVKKLTFFLLCGWWLVEMNTITILKYLAHLLKFIHLKHAVSISSLFWKSRMKYYCKGHNEHNTEILFLINMHLFIGLLLHILPPTSIIYILTKWKYLIISKLVWKFSNFKIIIPSFNFLFWHFLTVNLLAISGIKLIPIINWSLYLIYKDTNSTLDPFSVRVSKQKVFKSWICCSIH